MNQNFFNHQSPSLSPGRRGVSESQRMNEEGQGLHSSFIPSAFILAFSRESGNLRAVPFSSHCDGQEKLKMKREEYWKAALVVSTQSSNLETGLLTTATRLHNGAQGCRVATTLGMLRRKCLRNPNGVAKDRDRTVSQRSRCAATLGFV